MQVYRIYPVGADDHFKSVKVVECDSDEEALAAAEKMIGRFPAMEVWKLDKFIGRVGTPTSPRRA